MQLSVCKWGKNSITKSMAKQEHKMASADVSLIKKGEKYKMMVACGVSG